VTVLLKAVACILLSLALCGEQGYVTLLVCDHDAPQASPQCLAGGQTSSPESEPPGECPMPPCHDGALCVCHLSAIAAHQSPLFVALPSIHAFHDPSVASADDHPVKVFRPPMIQV
jgi:hypothetical protein